MSKSAIQRSLALAALGILLTGGAGCLSATPQSPSPIWDGSDDVQYFPSGTEFKLSREAAAMQAAKADAAAQDQVGPIPAVAPGPLPVPAASGLVSKVPASE